MADPKTAAAGQKQTLVEEGTELKGSLTSSCPVVVRGKIEGDVATPSLTVSATGAVHGRAKVGTLSSEGEVAGEFDADVVELSGRVRDKTVIRARSLEVKLQPANGKMQVVFGECVLDVGDAPVKSELADRSAPAAIAPSAPEETAAAPTGRAARSSGRGSVRPAEVQAKPNGDGSAPPPATPPDEELSR